MTTERFGAKGDKKCKKPSRIFIRMAARLDAMPLKRRRELPWGPMKPNFLVEVLHHPDHEPKHIQRAKTHDTLLQRCVG